jgi:hypothetical protein
MTGSYTMDTSRLRSFLGGDYEEVIQFTIEEALEDSFKNELKRVPAAESPARSA